MTGSFELAGQIGALPYGGLLVLFGFTVGVLTGLFGVGGGFVITPLLNALFGIPYNIAVGSSLSFTVGTSASGALRHWRLGNLGPKSVLILAGGAISGALLGSHLHETLRSYLVSGEEGTSYDTVMNVLFIVMLLPTAVLVYRGVPTRSKDLGSPLQRLPLPPFIDLQAACLSRVSLPGLTIIGLTIGCLSGLMGVGGGVFLVPMLTLLAGFHPHAAVGASLGAVLFSSITGTIAHSLHGNVDLLLAMKLLIGSTLGVQLGAAYCQKLDAPNLSKGFAWFIAAVVAFLTWQTWRMG